MKLGGVIDDHLVCSAKGWLIGDLEKEGAPSNVVPPDQDRDSMISDLVKRAESDEVESVSLTLFVNLFTPTRKEKRE